MGKRFYTFIVVPNASSQLHKLKLPVRALYILAAIGILSFFVAVGLGFSYAKMAFKAADYDKLQAENGELRTQTKALKVSAEQLNTKIRVDLRQRLNMFVDRHNSTVQGVLEAALDEYMARREWSWDDYYRAARRR